MEKELKEQFEKMGKHIDEKLDEVLLITKSGFDELSDKIDNIEKDVRVLKQDVGVLKQDVGVLKQEVKHINGVMPTKSYIDDKMADLGAEIGKRINRAYEEQRLFAVKLVEFLKVDRALKKDHVEQLEEMLA